MITTTGTNTIINTQTQELSVPEDFDNSEFDVIVIGGGISGCALAEYVSVRKLKVALLECNKIGGQRIHDTTLPIRQLLLNQGNFRHVYAPRTAEEIHYELTRDLRNAGVTIISAAGWVNSNDQVIMRDQLTGKSRGTIRGKNIILATGTTPKQDNLLVKLRLHNIMSPAQFLESRDLPDRKLAVFIYGHGVEAIECALLLTSLGFSVVLCSESASLLPDAPDELQIASKAELSALGVSVYLNTIDLSLSEIDDTAYKLKITLRDKSDAVEVGAFIYAGPRVANTTNLGIRKLGIKTAADDNRICVDSICRTHCRNVLAIGSVISPDMLSFAAHETGRALGSFLLGDCQCCPNMSIGPQVSTLFLSQPAAWVSQNTDLSLLSKDDMALGYASFDNLIMTPYRHGNLSVLLDTQTGEILGGYARGFAAEAVIKSLWLAMHYEITAFMLSGPGPWDSAIVAAVSDALSKRGNV